MKLKTKGLTILALIVAMCALIAPAAAQPSTPFMIYGWVNYTNGAPVNNPTVSINNTNTSEVFTAETNESYNYYQTVTSSDNVSMGNILNFNASNGNVKEFNDTVTEDEMNGGGCFVQNITISGIANHVVISEVYVDAINESGTNRSEFVELYNPTDTAKSLAGWTLSDREGTITLSGTIYAHKFYLVGMKGYNDYKDNTTWPNADIVSDAYLLQLANGGDEVILNNSAGEVVDTVGWGTATTNETINADKPGENESLQRKVNATINESTSYGPAWDTNNNSADFFIQTNPNPQFSGTGPVPPIPELPTLILFSSGLIILACYVVLKRRR
jgi:hypothetical protein